MDENDYFIIGTVATVVGMIIWKRHNRQKLLTAKTRKIMKEVENLADTYSLLRQIEMDRKFNEIVNNYNS